jgi:succinylglutamate desuccinylase
MSNPDEPDQDPKTQPKWSGGPPRPPKITARGLDDGASEGGLPDNRYAIVEFMQATQQAGHLVELLECIRGSQLVVALNKLEADLDACIVELGKSDQLQRDVFRKIAALHLETIRAYRDRHPRRGTGDRALRDQARKILDRVKKSKS